MNFAQILAGKAVFSLNGAQNECSQKTGIPVSAIKMVIGNGLLAKRFGAYKNQDAVIIFASGVSDSKTADPAAFEREKSLLQKTLRQNPGKLLVYFSTCSVLDKSLADTPYIQHKLEMERYLRENQALFLIFRISNIAGKGGNPKTIFNYLVNTIKKEEPFELWTKSYRNLIDIDHAYLLMDYFIRNQHLSATINIANPKSYNTQAIVQAIEKFTGKKARFTPINKGDHFFIDTIAVQDLAPRLNIHFEGDYLSAILQKYHSY